MFYQDDLTTTLLSIPWFRDLTPAQVDRIAHTGHIIRVDKGRMLFNEGEQVKNFYLILNGQMTLDILVPTRGPVCVFNAEPLDMLGWSSFTPVVRQRTASAKAVTDCDLVEFDGDALSTLCEADHDIGYVIMKRMANLIASHYLTARIQLCDLIATISQTRQVSTME